MGCLLGLVAAVGAFGLIKPNAIRWLYVGVTVLMYPVGWLVNLVILAVMFYLVLTPVAIVCRLCRRDPLKLHDEPQNTSLWTSREGTPDPGRYLRQF